MKKTSCIIIALIGIVFSISAQTSTCARIHEKLIGDWKGTVTPGWTIPVYEDGEYVDDKEDLSFSLQLNEDGSGQFALEDVAPISITWQIDWYDEIDEDTLYAVYLSTKEKKLVIQGKKHKWDFLSMLDISITEVYGNESDYLLEEGILEKGPHISYIKTMTPDTVPAIVDAKLLAAENWGVILDEGKDLITSRQYNAGYAYVYEAATHRHARQLEAIRYYGYLQGYIHVPSYKHIEIDEAVKELAESGDEEAAAYYERHYARRGKLVITK